MNQISKPTGLDMPSEYEKDMMEEERKQPRDFYHELQSHDGARLAVTNLLTLLIIRGRVGVFLPVRLRLLPWNGRHFLH